jgi:hypothetical protein
MSKKYWVIREHTVYTTGPLKGRTLHHYSWQTAYTTKTKANDAKAIIKKCMPDVEVRIEKEGTEEEPSVEDYEILMKAVF